MNNVEQDTVDVEALFNKFSVAKARSEKIVRSWLPPPSESDATAGSQHDDEAADPSLASLDARTAEDWIDTVGIGYRPAGESLEELAGPKRSLLSNDRLRSLLLGTDATKAKKQGRHEPAKVQIHGKLEGIEGPLPQRGTSGTALPPSNRDKTNAHATKRSAKDDDSDEELGRSAIGRKKKGRP